jgi:cytochrome b561
MRDRYSTVAIVFHWLIAAALVLQMALGFHMQELEGLGHSTLLQLHKSVGITVLLLTFARLAWRFVNPPPPHGTNLHNLEKLAAHWVHLGFYGALFALPLTGWAMVSLERAGGFKLFGAIPFPGLPGASALPGAVQDTLSDGFDTTHTVLVWMMLALVGLHVAGALKHQFVSRDRTIARMAPGVKPGSFTDPRLLAIPAVAAIVAAAVYAPKLPEHTVRPKPKDVASADIYLDVVGPSLERRCGFCHSDASSRGGLALTSYADIMAGGRSGKSVIPFHPEKSELLRRITLPMDHKQYMPKDGKPPPGPSEIAAIRWWIAQGAPASAKVGSLKLTPEAKTALKTLILGGDDDQGGDNGPQLVLPAAPKADGADVNKAIADGFIVRKVDAGSNLLSVDYAATKPVTPEIMADLAKLAPQLYTLNLRHAGVTDAMVKTIAGFPHLNNLRLEANAVTDAAAKDIAGIKTLTYLNMVGTKITDASLPELAALPKLQRIFIWNTAITTPAVQKAKAEHASVFFDTGLTAKDVVVDNKTMVPTN